MNCLIGRLDLQRWMLVAAFPASLLGMPACADGQQMTPVAAQAEVSMETARAVALNAFPGKIVDEELEQEAGGSGLRYSFDIKGAGDTHEVGVDAKTGRLLENSLEGANPD